MLVAVHRFKGSGFRVSLLFNLLTFYSPFPHYRFRPKATFGNVYHISYDYTVKSLKHNSAQKARNTRLEIFHERGVMILAHSRTLYVSTRIRSVTSGILSL